MHSLIEFLLASSIALAFHFGLHMEKEAYTVFGVGLLLALSVYLIMHKLEQIESRFKKLFMATHPLDSLMDQLSDPESTSKGRSFMAMTESLLKMLSEGAVPLTEGEYYYEASQSLTSCKKEIRAVNSIEIADWMGKVQKENYYRDQVRARESGLAIRRIFVIRPQNLLNEDILLTVRHQLADGIDVRIAMWDDLHLSGAEQVEMPINFVLFDEGPLIHRSPLFGIYYGKKVSSRTEVARFNRIYKILEQHAQLPEDVLPGAKSSEVDKISDPKRPQIKYSGDDQVKC